MTGLPRSMPALVTAMGVDGTLDLDAHETNIELVRNRGARGVVLAGSTGEGPYLEEGERARLIERTRRADPDLTVICGIHAESTRAAVRLVGECRSADGALVVTPTSLVRGRTDAVVRFYRDVADVSAVPIFLYSVPSVTGWELPVDAVRALAAHPGIAGIKDSGGDPNRTQELRDVIDAGFTIYAGASRALAASARAGAWGAITASANYALADVSLASRGDDRAQRRLTELVGTVERHGLAGTKYAAELTGLIAGAARLPILPLSEDAKSEIASALSRAGLTSSQ